MPTPLSLIFELSAWPVCTMLSLDVSVNVAYFLLVRSNSGEAGVTSDCAVAGGFVRVWKGLTVRLVVPI